MEWVAAIAGVVGGLLALILYLMKRRDSPAVAETRREEKKEQDLQDFDKALGESNAADVTRLFSDLDDRAEPFVMRPADGDSAGGQGDKGAP